MPFPDFDPVLVQLGPLAIRWYALAYVAGILLGWRYAVAMVKNPRLWTHRPPPVTTEQVDDFILWVTLAIIVGGRLGHVLFYTPQIIWTDPLQILQIWNGGMSFHGGAIGVFLAIILFAMRNKVDLWRLGDLVAAVVPIGLFFGRVANFINGELWGRPTDAPWGVVFCNERIRETLGWCPAGEVARHPSQLYEAALEGIVLFLILRWATHGAKLLNRRGVVMGLFTTFYAVFRISLENVRQPDAGLENLPLGLTMGIYLSIPMLLFGLWLIWRGMREETPPALAPADKPA
ncbi:prolipoprotein diacylglyceryl transferase protein [Phenylobacterium zucineum HLK1]|uniref:Phosphatidylglycerol--prolipoprotein diacylglyceryl transferase n=1 Tax=Phenylobacterium zucineum (strain HLK1) TaxID=450851 RepID=LGT_PHEZH|nr:prolipoprotein diacylglyceryl transferase [Phenylobacterium zucineum]B4R8Q2.1 RecName: Full=Phosphatidylglycerol--prolipoprotein diacylglyceryl transferase [Phenylobacterium zucineum HLK1]ACG79267.1 prolipoprotein diacylglyceryl transferase protein [Phenylobacterium zucineum HLK1]